METFFKRYRLKSACTEVLLWNITLCSALILLRSLNDVKDARDNFFQFNAGFSAYLCSFIFYMGYCMFKTQDGLHPDSLVLWIIYPVLLHILAILFGAPFFVNWDSTLTFSLIQTSVILPTLITNNKRNILTPEVLLNFGIVEYSSIFGTWCSSVVIPLDWDRPWQVWPEPCCVGAVVGCLIGSTVCTLMRYFNKEKSLKL